MDQSSRRCAMLSARFDRQWIVPDHRLMNRSTPEPCGRHGRQADFCHGARGHSPTCWSGNYLHCSIPDLHHYKGSSAVAFIRSGPMRRRRNRTCARKSCRRSPQRYGAPVTPEDLFAYIAAVMAHPAFTARFKADLVRPGLRVPLTADKTLCSTRRSRSDAKSSGCIATASASSMRPPAGRKARRACRRTRGRPFPPTAPFPARPSRCRRP